MLCGRSVDLDKIAEINKPALEEFVVELSDYALQKEYLEHIRKTDSGLASTLEEVFADMRMRKAIREESKEHLGNPTEKGIKFDSKKPDMRLIPPLAEIEMAKVLTFGAAKYSADNWRLVEPERYISAAMRHVNAIRLGELIDPESGCHHAAHVMCCAAFLVELLESPSDLEGESDPVV